MAGVELGAYYVSVVPSTRGAVAALKSGIGGPAGAEASAASAALSKGIGGGVAAGSAAAKADLAGVGKQAESVSSVVGKLAVGAAAVTALSRAVRDADESRKVAAQTEAAIRSTGQAANVTAGQVGTYASAISKATGLDDEWVQTGANMLLTFKNIRNEAGKGNDIFAQTTKIMADMAVATGTDAKAAALQLGKALNDPITGVSKLGRVGVTFTDQQKAMIETMVKSGDVMGAQKIILKELESEFGGSAEAQASGLAKIQTELGNVSETVGTALLPMLDAAGSALTTVTPLLEAIPGPVLAGAVAIGGGAAMWTMFGGAVTRTIGTLTGWGASIRGVITGSTVATAATEGLAAAMSREAEAAAAASAATGKQAAAASKVKGAWGAAAVAATVASVGLTKWLDSSRRAPADIDAMTKSLERFAGTGQMTGAGQRQGGIKQLVDDIKLFKRESTGVNQVANNTVGAIYRMLPGAGDDRLTNLTKQINQWDQALASMVDAGNGEQAAQAFERIKTAMRAQGLSEGDIAHYLDDYITAADDAGVATDSLSYKLDASKAAMTRWWAQHDKDASKNGLVSALKAAEAQAEATRERLEAVASAGRKALGDSLSVPQAQDSLSSAQNALNQAIADARENGYTGDWMDMADTSQVAIDLRDKFRAVQTATGDLAGAMTEAGVPMGQVQLRLADLANRFADTGPIGQYKSALDTYRGSVDLLTESLKRQTQAQAEMTRAAQIDAFNRANPHLSMDANGNLANVPAGYTEAQWYSMWHGTGFGGSRASGGFVKAGTLYQVNELGTEFFRPNVSGTVIPMGQTSQVGASNRPIVVNIYNPQTERSSTSISRAGRELAAQIGGS